MHGDVLEAQQQLAMLRLMGEGLGEGPNETQQLAEAESPHASCSACSGVPPTRARASPGTLQFLHQQQPQQQPQPQQQQHSTSIDLQQHGVLLPFSQLPQQHSLDMKPLQQFQHREPLDESQTHSYASSALSSSRYSSPRLAPQAQLQTTPGHTPQLVSQQAALDFGSLLPPAAPAAATSRLYLNQAFGAPPSPAGSTPTLTGGGSLLPSALLPLALPLSMPPTSSALASFMLEQSAEPVRMPAFAQFEVDRRPAPIISLWREPSRPPRRARPAVHAEPGGGARGDVYVAATERRRLATV